MREGQVLKHPLELLCVLFIHIVIAIHRFLRRNPVKTISNSCYAHTDSKPQRFFQRLIADNSYSPFTHLKSEVSTNSGLLQTRRWPNSANVHPFEADILCLIDSPNVPFITGDVAASWSDMLDSYVWVDSKSGLLELVVALGKEKVFAVDTEQHSLRSFLGFTALMQISTGDKDFLVDVIALHDVMDVMRPIFADKSICKVFHGADNDIIWLQRDFHIYVVNMFDTAKACDLLSKPQKSLAYLLEVYCGVVTNKLLQRADWRHRPLTVDMEVYARTDTHYLLHIAMCLINELKLKSNEGSTSCNDKFDSVFEASRHSNMICLQLYVKEVEDCPGESAASSILNRMRNGVFGGSSKYFEIKFQDAVKCLCSWRDLMARIHDESLRYVLSDDAIIVLAGKSQPEEREICAAIKHAGRNDESVKDPLLPLSPVVCSHMEDLLILLQRNTHDLQAFFPSLLHKHIGPGGGCPLSIYNNYILPSFNCNLRQTIIPTPNGSKNPKHYSRMVSRQLFVKKFSCKAPVYHNCRIYTRDGRLLCYCDRKKIEWYLGRDLARVVEDDPPTIVLLFEPKGRPEDGDDNGFYIQTKRNICVGCGEGDHYLRYRIIPSCYRIHFPEHLKSHRSHDIVLLCIDCHEVAHVASERYKREIAVEFEVPLFVRKVVEGSADMCYVRSGDSPLRDHVSVSSTQLRSSAMALLRHGPRMPLTRREELAQIVRIYYGRSEIDREDLEKAVLAGMSPHERRRMGKRGTKLWAGLDDVFDCGKCGVERVDITCKPCSKSSVSGQGPHGKQVVDRILRERGEEGIARFCQRWRRVFVDALRPRFLPSGWDVMHSGRREFGDYSVYNPSNKTLGAA